MADVTLSRSWAPTPSIGFSWLDRLTHRATILRRRARRNRYLVLIGRAPRRPGWAGELVRSMGGRPS